MTGNVTPRTILGRVRDGNLEPVASGFLPRPPLIEEGLPLDSRRNQILSDTIISGPDEMVFSRPGGISGGTMMNTEDDFFRKEEKGDRQEEGDFSMPTANFDRLDAKIETLRAEVRNLKGIKS